MKALKIIILIIAFLPLKFYGQCFSYVVITTPPSCPSCCDGSITIDSLTGGCPPYSYTWSNGSNIPTVYPICYDSTFTLTITDAGQCCPDTTFNLKIASPTNLNEYEILYNSFIVAPNPNNGSFTIDIGNIENATIEIYNISGQLILKEALLKSITPINLKENPKGIYFVKVETENKAIVRKITYQ